MNFKRIIAWTAGIILSLILILFVAGYFVLKSEGFRHYVLGKIEQQGHEATGGQVHIDNFDFRLSALTAHAYGLTIRGTEPPSEQPLLAVDQLTVRLKILSLLHQQVNLRELLVEHPVIHLRVDNSGRNNLPQPDAPKNKSSQTDVFDLAVGHVLITRGEVNYNDRKIPVDADLHDLRAENVFRTLSSSYHGSIVYHDGHLQYAGLQSLPHNLDLRFDATRSAFTLPSFVLNVGSSRLSLQASVSDYNNPKIAGSYAILIHTQDAAQMLQAAKPAGDISLSGKLDYQSAPGHTFLRDVILNGRLDSDALKIVSPQADLDLRRLNSRYQLAGGNFQTDGFSVDVLNGKLQAQLAVQHLDQDPATKISATLAGISLQAVKTSLKGTAAKTFPLTGTIRGSAGASWTGSMQNLQARSDLEVAATATNSVTNEASTIPISGALHLAYDGPRNIITVSHTKISTPKSSLLANGQISGHSNLSIQASTSDLRELQAFATLAQTAKTSSGPPSPTASGEAVLNAVIAGSLQAPRIAAQMNAQNLTVQGTSWQTLNFTAQASPSGITVEKGSLLSAHEGQITFSGSSGLHNWSYAPSEPISAHLSVKQMPASQLEQIAHAQYPVDGYLSGDLTLHGSQLNPVGNGSLQLTKARISNEPVQHLAADFHALNGTITAVLNVALAAGSATSRLTFVPKTKAYTFQLDAPGIVLNRLQTLAAKNLPVIGTVTATARGEGTLDHPRLNATIQLPKLQLRDNTVTGIKAELNVADEQATLLLSSDVAQATLRAHATVNLTGDYFTEAAIDTSKIPLEPLLAIFVPTHPAGFEGATELHATLRGPLKDKTRIEAHVSIPTLTASYQTLQVGNSGPIHIDYTNAVLVLQPFELKGTDSDLRLQARVPVSGTQGISATAKGSVDLRLLQIIDSEIKSSGTVGLEVNTEGTTQHPIVHGQIRLNDASLYMTSAPLGLAHANGILEVGTDQVRIAQLTGQVGGGDISAGGTITYRPQLQFNVALHAKSVRLLYPEGLRIVLSSDLGFTGNMNDAALDGRVLIDSLSFTPDFDLSSFMSQFGGASVPPTGQSFADNVKLNVSIQSTGQLAATSSQVSLQGQANLRAVGTAADPVIVGRADLNSGDVFFLNNRYQLQRGVFTFNNPSQTEPTVNLAATTTIQQYNLTINVNGPIEKLQTSYVSDPPLSTVDIINLIARGQTTQQADTTNLSANSLIAQGVASKLSSGVQKLAGLSSLSIDPLLGGNNSNPSARIAVQQRLSRNFFFTFSTDVTQPQSEIVQGEYQINKRWSVSANRDASGGVAVEGKFHTNF